MALTAEVEHALVDLARTNSGQVLASLTRAFNSLDLADEAVQEAMIEAANRWPSDGVPDNPGGWLYQVARRKGLDRIRRAGAEERRLTAVAPELAVRSEPDHDEPSQLIVDESTMPATDERLHLMLLCCHPALSSDAQVALTLRLVGGLTTEEIAAAFLVPTPTLAARITRAKKKIRQAAIPLSVPDQLNERIDAVLATLYLVFNEGYLSRGSAVEPMRVDLCDEAIRLGSVVSTLAPDHAEAHGLLSMMQLTHARRDARFHGGTMVLLDQQDRSTWRLDEISAGNATLRTAISLMQPGPYQVQALIASHHSNARTSEDTDWPSIVALYAQLMAMRPSPIVALNRAVAVAMADGPLAGLRELALIDALNNYHLLHATRGELLARSGERTQAIAAYTHAKSLTSNLSEISYIDERIAGLATPDPSVDEET